MHIVPRALDPATRMSQRTMERSRHRLREGKMQSVVYDVLVIAARGSRCRAFTRVGLRETKATATQRIPDGAVMRAAGDGADGAWLRAFIVILWRAGLRIGEALDLAETDLDAARGAVLVRRGKGAVLARSGWTVGRGRGWSPGWPSGAGYRWAVCCV